MEDKKKTGGRKSNELEFESRMPRIFEMMLSGPYLHPDINPSPHDKHPLIRL